MMRGLPGLLAVVWVAGCSSTRSVDPSARRELAPTGSRRVAIAVAPAASTFYSTRNSGTGQVSGVAVDLGAELARQLGVPVRFVAYANSGEVTDAAARDEWDVTFMPVDEERARKVDFGPAYNLFESTYLVGARSTIQAITDVDRPGVRVGLIENTTTGRSAARQIRHATLRHYQSVDELATAVATQAVDAIALSQASLRTVAARLPGARILPGSFHSTANAVAVPKDRLAAGRFVARFIEAAKASGEVRRAFDRAGFPDATVAPASPLP